MSTSTTFFVLAIGQYGATDIAVQVGFRSENPAKQLLELGALRDAVIAQYDSFKAQVEKPIDAPRVELVERL
jgi:hypothetical protein